MQLSGLFAILLILVIMMLTPMTQANSELFEALKAPQHAVKKSAAHIVRKW